MKFQVFLQDQNIAFESSTSQQPLASVILPLSHQEHDSFLISCIESVRTQTVANFELIIIDDRPDDRIKQIVTRFAQQDARLTYIQHATTCGLPAVRLNEGILRARAPFIASIFADQCWSPKALETLLQGLETSGADLAYGNMMNSRASGMPSPQEHHPTRLEILQNRNTIPQGAVLCRTSLFATFGLYDPHLILRRVYDWDLWLRALKGGAHFTRLQTVIGDTREGGTHQDVGQPAEQDDKVVRAYLQDEGHQRERDLALHPQHIADYDVTNPEPVIRYLRSYNEWDIVERTIYVPFQLAHPDYVIDPLIRHNRRNDAKLLGYQLNGPYPIFHDRRRLLFVANRYTRVVQDWYHAVSQDPQSIVCICHELDATHFLPADLDQIVLFDCVSNTLLPFLQQCRRAGISVVYVIEHDMDNAEQAAEALALQAVSDQTFRVGGDSESSGAGAHAIPFVSRGIEIQSTKSDFADRAGAIYLGEITMAPQTVRDHVQAILDLSPSDFRWTPFAPSQATLPEWLRALENQEQMSLVASGETLPILIARYPNITWLVPSEILTRYSSYHHQLMEEDLAAGGGVLLEVNGEQKNWRKEENSDQPLRQLFLHASKRLRETVTRRGTGLRSDARWLHLRNILLGVALRKKIADLRGEDSACSVTSLVLVNSQLFGGSEMYGFLVAKALASIGFPVRVCVPEWDEHGSGSTTMETWLAANHLPPLLKMEYGKATRSLYDPSFREQPVIDYAETLSDELDAHGAGLIFCSGFIAEPIIAQRRSRLVYMALFPPWGYALKRMTFTRDRLNGLVSDSEWATKIWGEWFAPPVATVPSLIEPEYFIVRNQNLSSHPVCIAVVGTMIATKRQKEVLLAVRTLIAAGYDLRLNYYGSELSLFASYIEELKNLAAQPPLKGRVFFNGYIDDPTEISRDNHLVVSASGEESIPQGMMYNQAAGLVAIACPAGGVAEVVRDGQTGFLAQGFQVEDIVDVLQRALHRQSEWPQIIARARQLLINEASAQVITHKLLQVMSDGAAIHIAKGNALFSASSPDRVRPVTTSTAISAQEDRKLEIGPTFPKEDQNLVIGPDLSKTPLQYVLHFEEDNLAAINLRLCIFHMTPSGSVTMKLASLDTQHVLRQVVVDAGSIVDRAWVQLRFAPLYHSRGQHLRIILTADLQVGRLALYQPGMTASGLAPRRSLRQRLLPRTVRFPSTHSQAGLYPSYQHVSNP